jgi:serpin B
MFRRLLCAATLFAALPAFADTSASPEGSAIGGSNALAIDLYKKVAADPGNFVFSPTSISLAFAMAQQGAAGETAAEMARVLHSDGKTGFAEWQKALAALGKKSIQLDLANSLWGQKSYPFAPAYFAALQHDFAAKVEAVDFPKSFDQVRKNVNAWVEKQTHDRIKDLLAPGTVSDKTRLILANAIYFKGNWAHQFKKEATHDVPFHSPGETHPVKMMAINDDFRYGSSGEVSILEMPYEKSDLAMEIVLPNAVDGLPAIEKSLDVAMVDRWMKSLHGADKVDVQLPRWKGDKTVPLTEVMKQLGMKKAFSQDDADFSKMLKPDASRDDRLYISYAIHKAFILVDEKGSEAAAATAIVMNRAASVEMPTMFHADHPFLYMIRDTKSGAILFMGRVTDPAK